MEWVSLSENEFENIINNIPDEGVNKITRGLPKVRANAILEHIRKDEWKAAFFCYNKTPLDENEITRFEAFTLLYDYIPTYQLYDVVLFIYTSIEFLGRRMVEYIDSIEWYKPENVTEPIKEKIDEKGYITIYRGGKEEENPEDSISWTISYDIAVWFAERFLCIDKNTVVYKGIIKEDRIIAYIDDREESEILQYGNVKNIEIIKRLNYMG